MTSNSKCKYYQQNIFKEPKRLRHHPAEKLTIGMCKYIFTVGLLHVQVTFTTIDNTMLYVVELYRLLVSLIIIFCVYVLTVKFESEKYIVCMYSI